jgi:hypothetical protein
LTSKKNFILSNFLFLSSISKLFYLPCSHRSGVSKRHAALPACGLALQAKPDIISAVAIRKRTKFANGYRIAARLSAGQQ